MFGEIVYERTYYKHKREKEYGYLSDEILGIEKYDRMDISLMSEIIENSLDLSYEKSKDKVLKTEKLSRQSVLNSIRKVGELESNFLMEPKEQKEVDVIYIEADEDHVAMQDGSNKQVKLIYVHEGKKELSEGRNELINKKYFTGNYKSSEELWLEVAQYIDKAYNLDVNPVIYLSGDGANWIKEGLNWIKGSIYVLDYFHLSKYVKKATAHVDVIFRERLWGAIGELEQGSVRDVFIDILKETEIKTKRKAVVECQRYIFNNWEGIVNRHKEKYIGCSAEGHISHILSDRLSSRPMGWSAKGSDQMARLRVCRANGGNIYDMVKAKKKIKAKAKRIEKFDKRIVKGKIKNTAEKFGNITILNTGKVSTIQKFLINLRGA